MTLYAGGDLVAGSLPSPDPRPVRQLSLQPAPHSPAHGIRPSSHRGMVSGMATKKVTITLDEAQLDKIRVLVGSGTAQSVSGFIQHAVSVALDDVAGWGAMLAEALRQTGGPLTDEERAWADAVLGTGPRSAA
jgi:Arc/MetJ-type ribon-helix-helix transcriptional regulator